MWKLKGIATQQSKLIKKEKKGDKIKKKKFDLKGTKISFNNNFKPSAKGCKTPKIPILEGPFLLCTEAKTFLSKIVKKATDKIIGIKVNKVKIINFKKKNKKLLLINIKFKLLNFIYYFNKK